MNFLAWYLYTSFQEWKRVRIKRMNVRYTSILKARRNVRENIEYILRSVLDVPTPLLLADEVKLKEISSSDTCIFDLDVCHLVCSLEARFWVYIDDSEPIFDIFWNCSETSVKQIENLVLSIINSHNDWWWAPIHRIWNLELSPI